MLSQCFSKSRMKRNDAMNGNDEYKEKDGVLSYRCPNLEIFLRRNVTDTKKMKLDGCT